MADQATYNQRGSASHSRKIGITKRATPLAAPWTGDLRMRFSDFQVNEIGLDGTVYRLHSLGLNDQQQQISAEVTPTEASHEKAEGQGTPQNGVEAKQPKPEAELLEVSPEDAAALEALTGSRFAQELVQMLLNSQGPDAEKKPKPILSDPLDDKSKRGEIHQTIRRISRSRIETNTDDTGAIRATLIPPRKNKPGRGGRRDRGQQDDERPAGEHLHFTLYKDNRDTMDAINQVARFLRVKPQLVCYAGTKDRRASTVQRCSVRYARQRSLAAANGKIWGLATGDYQHRKESIRLGQLLGNEFTITIKNCQLAGAPSGLTAPEQLQALEPTVRSALDHMAEHGWINYFGHQRFGTHQIGTHEIGQLLLKERFEDAVNAILSYDPAIAQRAEDGGVPEEPSKRDELARHHGCMLFRTGKDPHRALQVMPKRFAAEVAVIRHLTRDVPGARRDFSGAIVFITRGLRTMYLHAYQSYVWNHVASRRWEMYGDRAVEGDLVLADDAPGSGDRNEEGEDDDIINPLDDDDSPGQQHARALTAAEAASGRFSAHDVVLPSPGYDVTYPSNAAGDFYAEFMGRPENGALDPHAMRRLRREFSLGGRYRRLLGRFLAPPAVELRLYADDTEQMCPTDLDRVRARSGGAGGGKRERAAGEGQPPAKRAKVGGGEVADAGDAAEDASAEKGSHPAQEPQEKEPTKVAAIVRFQLGSSAYATVTLRELMGDPPE